MAVWENAKMCLDVRHVLKFIIATFYSEFTVFNQSSVKSFKMTTAPFFFSSSNNSTEFLHLQGFWVLAEG